MPEITMKQSTAGCHSRREIIRKDELRRNQAALAASEGKPSSGYQLAHHKDNPESQARLAAIAGLRCAVTEMRYREQPAAPVIPILDLTEYPNTAPAREVDLKSAPAEAPVDQILLGDCFELAKGLQGGSVNLVITSPPYADIRNYGDKVLIVHPDEYVDWIMPLLVEIHRLLASTGSFILNIGSKIIDRQRHPFVHELILRAIRETGLKIYDEYYWIKRHHMPNGGPKRLNNSVEHLVHFCKNPRQVKLNMDEVREPYDETSVKRAQYKAPGFACKVDENGRRLDRDRRKMTLNPKGKVPSNAFSFPTAANERGKIHPAAFHEDLPSWFIKALTDPGDIVLDTFAGSGTTCIAAKKLNRRYIGMELNPAYHTDAVERVEKAIATNAAMS